MATQVATQTQSRGTSQRGRKGNRGRGGNRGGRGGKAGKAEAKGTAEDSVPQDTATELTAEVKVPPPVEADGAEEDDLVCWICAEPVKYYALSQCGHRTCHVCALRLRALYKKLECTFCKVRQISLYYPYTLTPLAIGGTKHSCLHCVSGCTVDLLHPRVDAVQRY